MSQRPWMPLYIADYRNKTAHLSAAEHGAYLLLIMHYWVNKSLPKEDDQLCRIAAMTPQEWKKSRATLQGFFFDGWRHERVEEELQRVEDISCKRRAAAEQRHSKRDAIADANAPSIDTTNQIQMETHARVECVSSSEDSLEKDVERSTSPPYTLKFEEFWKIYPHKVGKKAAESAFDKAKKLVDAEKLKAGLLRYAAKTDDRPWCNPATWLNQGRWDDQPAAVVASAPKPQFWPSGIEGVI